MAFEKPAHVCPQVFRQTPAILRLPPLRTVPTAPGSVMLASTSRSAFKRTSTLLGSTNTPLVRQSAASATLLPSGKIQPCMTAHSPLSFLVVQGQRRHAGTAYALEGQRPDRRRPSQGSQVEDRQRARPYQFKQNTSFRGGNSGTALARYNLELGRHIKDRLPDVLNTCAKMKQEGVQPDITTYHHLLRHCADGFWHEEARAILEDMQLSGITPDRQACNYLLQVR
jgi:pentatricopeptide repeat protein